MVSLVLYLLAVLGLSYIITRSEIMAPLRCWWNKPGGDPRDEEPNNKMAYLFSCPRCTAFWGGLALALPLASIPNLLGALASVGFVELYYTLYEIMEGFLRCAVVKAEQVIEQ